MTTTSTGAWSWFILVVLVASARGIPPTRTVVHDIRGTYGIGALGRFLVERGTMEGIIGSRVGDTQDVVLASTVPPRPTEYDTDRFTEVLIFFGNFTDTTLQGQSPSPEWPSKVSFQGRTVMVLLPVAIRDYRFNFVLDYFTDALAPLMVPFVTNYRSITYVDAIRNYDDSLVILQDNIGNAGDDDDDLFVVSIEHRESCTNNIGIGHDFDESLGKGLHLTGFPMSFDWGCDEYNFGFCKDREYMQYQEQLRGAAGNVCTTMATGYSNRCAAAIRVEMIAGSFSKRMPYLSASPSSESIEAEWVEREHNVGLVSPCIA